jgi:hypothetical protein
MSVKKTKTGLTYFAKGSPEAKAHMARLRAMQHGKASPRRKAAVNGAYCEVCDDPAYEAVVDKTGEHWLCPAHLPRKNPSGRSVKMDWDQWDAKFQPERTSTGDYRWLDWTVPADLKRIKAAAKRRTLWTEVSVDRADGKSNVVMLEGYHFVNRLQYIVTKRPYAKGSFYEVIDQDEDSWLNPYAATIDGRRSRDTFGTRKKAIAAGRKMWKTEQEIWKSAGAPTPRARIGAAKVNRNSPRRGKKDPIDREIEKAWYRLASGVQVMVLDIPKIFRDVRQELSAGTDMDSAVRAAIARYQAKNPHIVIDPSTNRIQAIERGHPMKTFPRAHDRARLAAQKLGRRQVVVAHPYVPKGFKKGVEVSPLFYHYGSVEVDAQGQTYKRNPGLRGLRYTIDGRPGDWTVWSLSEHTGSKKDPVAQFSNRGQAVAWISGRVRAEMRKNPTDAYTGQWFDAGKALWDDLDEREAQALFAMLRENRIASRISIDADPKKFGAHRFSVYLTEALDPADTYSRIAIEGVANRFAQALSEKRIMRLKDVPGMEYGSQVYTRGGRASSLERAYAPRKKGILHRKIEKKNPLDSSEIAKLFEEAREIHGKALEALATGRSGQRGGHRWDSFEKQYETLGGISRAIQTILYTDRQRRGLDPKPETAATKAWYAIERLHSDLYNQAVHAGLWYAATDNPKYAKHGAASYRAGKFVWCQVSGCKRRAAPGRRTCAKCPSLPIPKNPYVVGRVDDGREEVLSRHSTFQGLAKGRRKAILTRGLKTMQRKYPDAREHEVSLRKGPTWNSDYADNPRKNPLIQTVMLAGMNPPRKNCCNNPGRCNCNPLTTRETARLAQSAGFWSRAALTSKKELPMYRGYAAGRAEGLAEAITKYGPKRGRQVADRIRSRASRALGAVVSTPREARLNPQVNIPWKEGQRIPIEKARAWVKSTGDAELLRQFEEAYKLQCKANRKPEYVVWQTIAIGSPRRLDAVTAMVQYGESPETMYKPPQGSKKGSHMYRHEWGEGNKGGRKSVPLLAAPGGKAVVMPMGKGQTVGDWMRG